MNQYSEEEFKYSCPLGVKERRGSAISLSPNLRRSSTSARFISWTPDRIKETVIDLAVTLKKSLSQLTLADFNSNGLDSLILFFKQKENLKHKSHDFVAEEICTLVFMDLLRRFHFHKTIIPLTKTSKPILWFSPHPDDDVISSGGAMINAVESGHEVHVAYAVNGSIAVPDEDVLTKISFLERLHQAGLADLTAVSEAMTTALKSESTAARTIKQVVREAEALSALRALGIPPNRAHFLDLPFYKTGQVLKKAPGAEDVQRVLDLVRSLNPGHIFICSDLADPHGTHASVYNIIKQALQVYHAEIREAVTPVPCPCEGCASYHTLPAVGEHDVPPHIELGLFRPPGDLCPPVSEDPPHCDPWGRPKLWLYRGAWAEFPLTSSDLLLGMSTTAVDRKRTAILCHGSQRDTVMFPGDDPREFWERARDRNSGTAARLVSLGLPKFEGVECYVTCYQL
eukprot:gnl/Dysnectes_brevis/1659_a1887_916.p1 GENE.gnl/Dysnectes_brevis/1659_a1887_916~~gnl/Dysnectes_brevis/1659_a1887_916.p1  ORF type:complete len:469 (-),score=119.52 gnl/Dysnectes_brevis/1659_a1887_916:180-1547(-)